MGSCNYKIFFKSLITSSNRYERGYTHAKISDRDIIQFSNKWHIKFKRPDPPQAVQCAYYLLSGEAKARYYARLPEKIFFVVNLINKFINLPFLHPILFSAYPILALWLSNFGMLPNEVVVRPLVTSIVSALLIFIVFSALLKNSFKAALLCSLVLLLFYSYGHVYSLVEDRSILGFMVGRHRFLAALWILLLITGSWLIIKRGSKAAALNRLLNLTGLILVILTISQIAISQIRTMKLAEVKKQATSNYEPVKANQQLADIEKLPDVYYIILDGYTRDDSMRQNFKYDNRPFINELVNLGFVVPACTHSNYSYTPLSMAATLNMNYLDALGLKLDPQANKIDNNLFKEYIRHSLVRQNFSEIGYKFVTFQLEYDWIQIPDPDVFIKENKPTNIWKDMLEISDFDELLSQTTLFEAIVELDNASPFINKYFPFIQNLITTYQDWIQRAFPVRSLERKKYDIIMNNLDQMANVSKMQDKKFVYLHLSAPHDPYVLGPDGSFLPIKNPLIGYTNQVTYLDKRMVQVVKTILENSKIPPVIILQGDHGWDDYPDTRTDILNAYYLPGDGSKLIYPNITPVNSFRIIFNHYFGGKFKLLPDINYYSPEDKRYNFEIAPQTCSDK